MTKSEERLVFLAFAEKAAREAGRIIARARTARPRVGYKGLTNPVTEVDLRSEQAIVKIIRGEFGGHRVVAEEGGEQGVSSEFVWWIDPLDGTANFSHGYPHYCVSIALEHRDEVVLGVIFDPIRDELFSAIKGRGARLNGKRISVSRVSDPKKALLATGFPYDLGLRPYALALLGALLLRTQGVRRDGSAALNLAYVASGRLDGFWEFGLNPWDTAAGIILVREAGGVVSDFDRRPYRIRRPDVAAANPRLHSFLIRQIRGIRRPDFRRAQPQPAGGPGHR